jgi:chromosome segregation protein
MLKLNQLAERASQRRSQIEDELTEIAQQTGAEASHKQDAEIKLAEYQVEIVALQGRVQDEKLRGEASEQSLNAQRQLVQDVVREMQEAAFYEKTCQSKIVEVENSIRSIDESVAELKSNLEKLQIEQGGFDEAQMNIQLHEWLTLREQREMGLAKARNVMEGAANELREIEQERMTSEQKLHPLRESISQARLKEQEARITESQFGEQLKEA